MLYQQLKSQKFKHKTFNHNSSLTWLQMLNILNIFKNRMRLGCNRVFKLVELIRPKKWICKPNQIFYFPKIQPNPYRKKSNSTQPLWLGWRSISRSSYRIVGTPLLWFNVFRLFNSTRYLFNKVVFDSNLYGFRQIKSWKVKLSNMIWK